MLLCQIEFALLLVCVAVLLRVLPRNGVQKNVLLCASYYFYMYWDWRFAGLLFVCTALNWLCGRVIHRRAAGSGARKAALIAAVTGSLALLGFFKYWDFFATSLNTLTRAGGPAIPVLRLILPLGISFFTFQALSYTIDLYRGNIREEPSFRDFALYVAFFPQLVAGPIVRASEFLPQLRAVPERSWARVNDGFRQYVFGFFKKALLADGIAPYVDTCFANMDLFDGATLWLVALAYAAQIYCDFSGYSDMAIGVARALGFDLAENFEHPYLARSLREFWRRWHISLSTWLRDYLYIPLGGSRRGAARTYVSVMLTMVLGGLWHGANWTFVAWGGMHGVALVLERVCSGRRGGVGKSPVPAASLPTIAGWLGTLLVVVAGWVLFRSQSLSQALDTLYGMATWRQGIRWVHPFSVFALSVVAFGHIVAASPRLQFLRRLQPNTLIGGYVLCTMLAAAIIWKPTGFHPFIYFQF